MTAREILDYCRNNTENLPWTIWESMPEPNLKRGRGFNKYDVTGVYQLRNIKTNEFILAGKAISCMIRMRSLFPEPYGTGKRNNSSKRKYILENWRDIECRTLETINILEAGFIENMLFAGFKHKFTT